MTFLDALRHLGFPEFIEGNLYFHPVAPKCAVCRGDLIGSEIRWSTCGDCGGRSINREGRTPHRVFGREPVEPEAHSSSMADARPSPSRRDSASHIPGPGELPEEGTSDVDWGPWVNDTGIA